MHSSEDIDFFGLRQKNLQELAEKQNLEEIKLNIWDFGTNHSTFFLRKGLSFEIRVNAKITIQTTDLCEAFLSCHPEELRDHPNYKDSKNNTEFEIRLEAKK